MAHGIFLYVIIDKAGMSHSGAEMKKYTHQMGSP